MDKYHFMKALQNPEVLKNLSALRRVKSSDTIVADMVKEHATLIDKVEISQESTTSSDIGHKLHFDELRGWKEYHKYDVLDEFNRKQLLLGLHFFLDQLEALQMLVLKSYMRDKKTSEYGGWEFVCDSSMIKNTSGYYGQIWKNTSTKQVSIVSAGTKIDFLSFEDSSPKNLYGVFHLVKDILNDFQVYTKSIPFQYKRGVEPFLEHFLTMEKDFAGYDILFAGHSLGGILSDLGSLYLHTHAKRGSFKAIHSITHENPGSKHAMESTYKHIAKNLGVMVESLDKIRDCFSVINNPENWVNTACEQFGDVYLNKNYRPTELRLTSMLPRYIADVITVFYDNFECHDKRHCSKIIDLEFHREWKVGLFDDFVHAQWMEVKGLIDAIPGRVALVSCFSAAAEILSSTKSYASKACSTATGYVEDVVSIFRSSTEIEEDDSALYEDDFDELDYMFGRASIHPDFYTKT